MSQRHPALIAEVGANLTASSMLVLTHLVAVRAREVLDSHGNPMVEVDVMQSSGAFGVMQPSAVNHPETDAPMLMVTFNDIKSEGHG